MDVEAILDWNDAGRVAAADLRRHPLASESRERQGGRFHLVTKESRALNHAAALLDR